MIGLSALIGLLLLVLAVACGPAATPTPTAIPEPTAVPPARVLVTSTDLAVESNRLAFALLDPETGPITVPTVKVTLFSLDAEPAELVSLQAVFRPWPTAAVGLYTVQVELGRAGDWGLQVSIPQASGPPVTVGTFFSVRERSLAPSLGERPPATRNRTSRDVVDLKELTSADPADPELYSMTVAQALGARMTAVVVFATPAYCASATCGPQMEIVRRLKALYRERVNFLHIEVFDNPAEIQGDLSRARLNPALQEWGLRTDPWTFILDAEGRVAAKFEGFTTEEELGQALRTVLGTSLSP